MAFREKTAWVSLIATLGVWGWYFATLGIGIANGGEMFGAVAGRFVLAVILLVVILIAVTIAIAIQSPKEADAPADARERDFALQGYRAAYFTLSTLVVMVMLAAPLIVHVGPALLRGTPAEVTAILIGNSILFAMVIAEVVQWSVQIVRFRMGG
jgi:uncharacterized membrane protein